MRSSYSNLSFSSASPLSLIRAFFCASWYFLCLIGIISIPSTVFFYFCGLPSPEVLGWGVSLSCSSFASLSIQEPLAVYIYHCLTFPTPFYYLLLHFVFPVSHAEYCHWNVQNLFFSWVLLVWQKNKECFLSILNAPFHHWGMQSR